MWWEGADRHTAHKTGQRTEPSTSGCPSEAPPAAQGLLLPAHAAWCCTGMGAIRRTIPAPRFTTPAGCQLPDSHLDEARTPAPASPPAPHPPCRHPPRPAQPGCCHAGGPALQRGAHKREGGANMLARHEEASSQEGWTGCTPPGNHTWPAHSCACRRTGRDPRGVQRQTSASTANQCACEQLGPVAQGMKLTHKRMRKRCKQVCT